MAAPLASMQTIRILWGALATSPLLMTSAMVFVRLSQPAPPPEPGFRLAFLLFAGLACLGAAPMARFVRDRMIDTLVKQPGVSPVVVLHRTTIIGAAICEGAAMVVVVAFFLLGEYVLLAGLLPCYVGFYWMMPDEAELQELARQIEQHASAQAPPA